MISDVKQINRKLIRRMYRTMQYISRHRNPFVLHFFQQWMRHIPKARFELRVHWFSFFNLFRNEFVQIYVSLEVDNFLTLFSQFESIEFRDIQST